MYHLWPVWDLDNSWYFTSQNVGYTVYDQISACIARVRPGINNNPVGSLSWALTLHISLVLVGSSGLTFSSSWNTGILYVLLCHVQGQAAGVQRITVLPVVRMIFFPGSLSCVRAPTASMVIARRPLFYSVSLSYSLWVLFSVRIGATPGFGSAELQTHCWPVVTLLAFFPICLLLFTFWGLSWQLHVFFSAFQAMFSGSQRVGVFTTSYLEPDFLVHFGVCTNKYVSTSNTYNTV